MAFGVYIHIPFCSRRCDYCAFATWTDRHHLIEGYIDACRTELARAELPDATSVFVGGGTPSLVPAASLAALLADVALEEGAEVTVECNPETVTPFLVDTLLDAAGTSDGVPPPTKTLVARGRSARASSLWHASM